MGVTVRRARVGDARDIARLHVSSWQVLHRGVVPAIVLTRLSTRASQRERQKALQAEACGGLQRTWVLVEEEAIRGFAVTGPGLEEKLATRCAELQALYLAPAHVRRGLGQRLCQHALADLARRGFELVHLWVLAGNRRAERFYRRAGFTADGCCKLIPVAGVGLWHHRLQRSLLQRG